MMIMGIRQENGEAIRHIFCLVSAESSGITFNTTILDCHRDWPSGAGISLRDYRRKSGATERFLQACKNAYGRFLPLWKNN
jgi:hypothetical protein